MSRIHDGIMAARCGPPAFPGNGIIRQQFLFPHDFCGFKGHFPKEPILPAVVQIAMGKMLAEMLQMPESGAPLELESMCRAKFLRKLGPDETITAQCKKHGSVEYRFDVALTVNQEPASAFSLSFSAQPKESV